MPQNLVEAEDAQGRKRLVSSPDQSRLITNEDCDICCAPGGQCPILRRFDRCPPVPGQTACANDNAPDHIWMCYAADGCGVARNSAAGVTGGLVVFIVVYLNACYQCTPTTIPAAQIPAGDRFVDVGQYTLATGNYFGNVIPGAPRIFAYFTCEDVQLWQTYGDSGPPCSICLLYYKATACPGQANIPVAPVFVPVNNVSGCGVFSFNGFCYTVQPGPTATAASIAAMNPPGVIADISPAVGDCCDCIPGCSRTIQTVNDCYNGQPTDLNCCCSDDFSFTINFNFTLQTDIINDLIVPRPPVESHQTVTSSISIGGSFIGGVLTTSQNQPMQYTVTARNYSVPPAQTDPPPQTDVYPLTMPLGCIPGLESFPRAAFNLPICGTRRQPPNDPVAFTEIVTNTTDRNCIRFIQRYKEQTWQLDLQSAPRRTYSFYFDVRLVPQGRCGGGCPSANGASTIPLPIQRAAQASAPVPKDQWPLWAKGIALKATAPDKGVGDTFARTAGTIGGKVFKAAFASIGLECGCAFRQAEWNAKYGY